MSCLLRCLRQLLISSSRLCFINRYCQLLFSILGCVLLSVATCGHFPSWVACFISSWCQWSFPFLNDILLSLCASSYFLFSNTLVESGHFLSCILFYCLLVPMIIFCPAFHCLWESVIIYWGGSCFIDCLYLCSLSLLVASYCQLVSVFSFCTRSCFIAYGFRWSFSDMYFIAYFIAVVISWCGWYFDACS